MITPRFFLDQSFLHKVRITIAGKPKIGMNRLATIELTKGKTRFPLFNAQMPPARTTAANTLIAIVVAETTPMIDGGLDVNIPGTKYIIAASAKIRNPAIISKMPIILCIVTPI